MNDNPSQPNELNMRHYQQEGASFLAQQRRAILADQMGIGKTAQAIWAMRYTVATEDMNSVLIVCPGSALYTWKVELEKWWPTFSDRFIVIGGNQKERDTVWLLTSSRSGFCICTYDVLRQDYKRGVAMMHWHTVICDEAHKFRNRQTQLYRTVKKLNSVNMFLLTGTPASKGPQDVWALLNVIHPRVYTSYWKFIDSYCITTQNLWGGKEIIGTKNMSELQSRMQPFFLRRTKQDVLPELPPKTRQLLPIEMTVSQSKVYSTLRDEMVADLNEILNDSGRYGDPTITSDVLAKITRLRQLLTCPKLIDTELDIGGGLLSIVDILTDADDDHCVIFTPFPSAFPFILRYLESYGFHDVYQLRGGMNPEVFQSNIEGFKATHGIMLASIEYAQGYSLETASTAYFLGYSWRPDSNYQAEDRLHRLTTTSPVNIYYMQHRGTIDDRVLEVLNIKQMNVDALLKSPQGFNDLRNILLDPT